ncbi:hypothetical protein [Streptomyces marispadix]|uniref:Uncharacterized protein n=1 Tax=Streptomyces marispadix TaxID=2922868 RepID=A0ABS9T3Z2_9ACTN|nr:hypothetical protein [Streptomyces marispadix]MCH6163245.1 hypothetical protein [Streptomyces marispadix]
MAQKSGTLVPVWFFSPEGFTPVALDEDPAARAERFADLINALYPQVSPEEKLQLVASTELLVHSLIEEGAVYLASFMYSLEDGAACSGMVTALMVDGPPPGGASFAERVVQQVPERFPGDRVDAGVVSLPAGKAALITRDVIGPSPVTLLSPDAPVEPEVQRQLEAYLPFPDGSAYLQIAIGTSDLDYWPDLLPMFGGFLAGISFTPHVAASHTSRSTPAATDRWARKEFG